MVDSRDIEPKIEDVRDLVAKYDRINEACKTAGGDVEATVAKWEPMVRALLRRMEAEQIAMSAFEGPLTLKKAVQAFAKWIGDVRVDDDEAKLRAGLMPMLSLARWALELDDPTYAFRRRAARRVRDELKGAICRFQGTDPHEYAALVASGLVMTTPVEEE